MEFDRKQRSAYPVWAEDIIRYRDLDPNAHASHVAIAEYFENGRVRLRHEHLSHLGEQFLTGFVLAKLSIEFFREVKFPGRLSVGTGVSRLGNSSYTLSQGLFSDIDCVASAEVITVYIDKESRRPAPLQSEFRAALADLMIKG
ncbi:MAG: thioesterase family protein [Pseudomonadota bacterium]